MSRQTSWEGRSKGRIKKGKRLQDRQFHGRCRVRKYATAQGLSQLVNSTDKLQLEKWIEQF
jgi:hypothetical protein